MITAYWIGVALWLAFGIVERFGMGKFKDMSLPYWAAWLAGGALAWFVALPITLAIAIGVKRNKRSARGK